MDLKKFFVFVLMVLFSLNVFSANILIDSTNYSPVPVSPGESFQLWVHVKNDSSVEAKNIVASLSLNDVKKARPDFPFSFPENEQAIKNFGNLKPYASALASFTVLVSKDALDGDYDVFIEAGEQGFPSKSAAIRITVKARKPQIELINSSALEARPGQKLDVVLSLKNTGNSRAINILAGIIEDRTVTSTGTIVSRSINPVGVSLKYVPELSPGESADVLLQLAVDSDVSIKTYVVPITLKWLDENRNEFSVTRYLGLRVNEEPEIDVALNSAEPRPFPGSESILTVDLFNKGASTAKNVVVELSSPEGLELDSSKFFIGTLESDDFDSFKVSVKIPSNASLGRHSLTVKILFKNSNLEDNVVEKTVDFTVVSKAESLNQGPFDAFIPLIALIVLALIGFFAFKRFKKKKG